MDEQETVKLSKNEQTLPLSSKLARANNKQQKMFQSLQRLLEQSIQAIQKAEEQLEGSEGNQMEAMNELHQKMVEIKPLKNLKEEYNDFYKKLTGMAKSVEELSQEQVKTFNGPKIFDDIDFLTIQESLADHYFRKKQFDAAEILFSNPQQRQLFEECEMLKTDILSKRFEQPAKWAEAAKTCQKQRAMSYELKKMKILHLVGEGKGAEALDYCQQQMPIYADIREEEIRKLIIYILTQSSSLWGDGSDELTDLFRPRYQDFESINLEQLARSFEKAYLRINQIRLENPITKCHEIGLKYQKQFMEQINYMPNSAETPKVLPFSLQISEEHRYHSQFVCPVNKEVYGPREKNVILKCGHMISGTAHDNIIDNRSSRRKLKCPICIQDQNTEFNMEVQF